MDDVCESEEKCECPDFCGEFLSEQQPERQAKIISVLHGILQKKCTNSSSMYEGVLKEIEDQEGKESFLSGIILKQIALSLLKVSEGEEAIKLVEQRLNNLKKEEFATLLIFGVLYEKKGDYNSALGIYQRANDCANQNDNKLQSAFSLLKLATSYWHLEHPETSHQFVSKGQTVFEEVSINDISKPEDKYLLVHYYKTMGYLKRINDDHRDSTWFYEQALDAIKKHQCSLVQEVKILSQIASAYAHLRNQSRVDDYCQNALKIVDEILKNTQYISAHAAQVIHITSRLGFAYVLVRDLNASVDVRERTLKISKDFLGDSHPEVARITSDLACLYQRQNFSRRSTEFLEMAEMVLKKCNYKNDESKTKLFLRELTDALNNLGFCNTMQSNYAAAAVNYREAIDINTQVYGETSLRTAKMMRFLGRTYYKWGKEELGREYLSKAVTVIKTYKRTNTKVLREITRELANPMKFWRRRHSF